MTTCVVENDHGCGFLGGIFQCQNMWPRKSSIQMLPSAVNEYKRREGNWSEKAKSPPKRVCKKPLKKPTLVSPRPSMSHGHQNQVKRSLDVARNSTSSSSTRSNTPPPRNTQVQDRQLALYHNHHNDVSVSTNGVGNKSRVPVSSGNITRLSMAANLKQPKSSPPAGLAINKALGYASPMGNILRKSSSDMIRLQGSTYGLAGETLKLMGNDKYKEGKYEEALALYEQAISLDPNQASYRGNRGAALMCLGRILEAVSECIAAIQIQPSYHRAHHRLATLYIRLGYAEKALYHLKHSGSLAGRKEIGQAQALDTCLRKCSEAKKCGEWTVLLKETMCALSSGADSAPKVYALQVEALLNLHRHEEAYAAYKKSPNLNIDYYTKIFSQNDCIALYLIRAQVYLAAGRFEDAIKAAQHAVKLNPGNKEARALLIRTKSTALARARGNKHFHESKFAESSSAYSEGLEQEPYNSVLLCNRAACRSKLGQFEKAIEDCTLALSLQPSYSKARLRRADCNAKLERWDASIRDYETLMRETPGNEEVGRALFEARFQLKKQRGDDFKDMKFGSNLVLVSSNECFRNYITSTGMSVVLFSNKTSQLTVQLLEPLCKRFPSINFLKVEVENHPFLAKSEAVSLLPSLRIYKNGSRVKEVPGNNLQLLESLVKLYSS